jgi:L-aspartate oxidase
VEHSDVHSYDVVIVGSGVAGLSAGVRLSEQYGLSVGILTKGTVSQSATAWAQGGVAAVIGGDEDSVDLHLADTLAAGGGLCDIEAVRLLVDEGPRRITELIRLGAVFDMDAGGAMAKAREGGHSMPRVLHAGGSATGAEVERALVDAVRSTCDVLEGWFSVDLVVDNGQCRGVAALDPQGVLRTVQGAHVILATGGAGQMFSVTTNPVEATGDGIAMALRAGVAVCDIEFIQFHPTALLHHSMPRPLLSEALRGHGARLLDANLEPFTDELAPRDVVSRAEAECMSTQGVDHVWLDARGLDHFAVRFPNIAAALSRAGLDPSYDLLPVAPAAHHISGGVVTDLNGLTGMHGLWAAGEVACSGVHGANRLASNSLLEGMVFGARVAEAIGNGVDRPYGGVLAALIDGRDTGGRIRLRAIQEFDTNWETVSVGVQGDALVSMVGGNPPLLIGGGVVAEPAELRSRLQEAMSAGAGVLRSADSLRTAGDVVGLVGWQLAGLPATPEYLEIANLVTLADRVLAAALVREETRGAHARREFDQPDAKWLLRLVH